MLLARVSLTPSGRPQLLPKEVEKALLDKVDLEFEGTGGVQGGISAERFQGGYIILTNQRLIWIDAAVPTGADGSRSCFLPLHAVHNCTKRTSGALGFNAKVRLELKLSADEDRQPCIDSIGARFHLLFLRCRGEAPDAFREQLWASVRAAHQQQPQLQQQASGTQAPAASSTQWSAAGPLHSGSSSWGGSADGGAAGAAHPDAAMLKALVDMGFPRSQAAPALLATNNEGAQQAIDWILAFGNEAASEEPPEQPMQQQQQQQATLSGLPGAMQQVPWQPQQRIGWSALPGPPISSQAPYQPQQQVAGTSGPLTAGLQRHQRPQSPYSALAALPERPPSPYGVMQGGGAATSAYSNPLLAPAQQQLQGSFQGPFPGGGMHGSSSQGSLQGGQQHQQHQQQSPQPSPHRGVGVAGIMQRESHKTSETSRSLEQAFSDLSALMAMAQHMVALAERFRGVMAASEGSGVDGSTGGEVLDWETQMQLVSMGIASPVTKESAGARYHIELSRQLADFLAGPLARAGGLLQLPDVYCLFNRARGTELVSPDDLLKAISLFPEIGVSMRLRRFPSGVSVIQAAQHSDQAVLARIAQLLVAKAAEKQAASQPPLEETPALPAQALTQAAAARTPLGQAQQELGPPLSAGDVASELGVPLAIAREQLLVAEAAGVLCRDDGPNGLQFFRNFFKDATPCA